jgi:hypothetical protein
MAFKRRMCNWMKKRFWLRNIRKSVELVDYMIYLFRIAFKGQQVIYTNKIERSVSKDWLKCFNKLIWLKERRNSSMSFICWIEDLIRLLLIVILLICINRKLFINQSLVRKIINNRTKLANRKESLCKKRKRNWKSLRILIWLKYSKLN